MLISKMTRSEEAKLTDALVRTLGLSENGRDAHKHLRNISLEHFEGDPTNRRALEQLPIESYDSIIVVADQDPGMANWVEELFRLDRDMELTYAINSLTMCLTGGREVLELGKRNQDLSKVGWKKAATRAIFRQRYDRQNHAFSHSIHS